MDIVEQICHHIQDVFQKLEIENYIYDSEMGCFLVRGINLDDSAISFCNSHIYVREEHFYSYTIFPFRADEYSLHKVADFINRLNEQILIGNFELDFNDGEIRFKINHEYGTTPIPEDQLQDIILFPLRVIKEYSAALLNIIFNNPDILEMNLEEAQNQR